MWVVAISCFVFGIPSALSNTNTLFANWSVIYGKTFFETIDDLVSLWFLPIGGLMIAIFTGWFLDKEISREEFSVGTKWRWLLAPWLFFMRWICPIAIVLIILQQSKLIDVDAYFKGQSPLKGVEKLPEPQFSFPGMD